jgi:hypothetical protein
MIISNLALAFGVLADSVEVLLAMLMMIGGIIITHLIQRWADRAGEQPAAANIGKGGTAQYQDRSMRE